MRAQNPAPLACISFQSVMSAGCYITLTSVTPRSSVNASAVFMLARWIQRLIWRLKTCTLWHQTVTSSSLTRSAASIVERKVHRARRKPVIMPPIDSNAAIKAVSRNYLPRLIVYHQTHYHNTEYISTTTPGTPPGPNASGPKQNYSKQTA